MRPLARSVTVRVECGRSSTWMQREAEVGGHRRDRAVGQGAGGVAGASHEVLGGVLDLGQVVVALAHPQPQRGRGAARLLGRRDGGVVAPGQLAVQPDERLQGLRRQVLRRAARSAGPSAAYAAVPCARSSSISRAARRDGGAASSRSVVVVPSAAARDCSRLSRGSRRPFSTSDSWLAVEPTSCPSSSSVSPRSVRACRMRRPSRSSWLPAAVGSRGSVGQVDDRAGGVGRHGVDA